MANRERAKAVPCVRRWEPTIFFLLLELVVYCYGCCCHGAVAVAGIGGVGIAVVVGCPRRWLLLVFFFLLFKGKYKVHQGRTTFPPYQNEKPTGAVGLLNEIQRRQLKVMEFVYEVILE